MNQMSNNIKFPSYLVKCISITFVTCIAIVAGTFYSIVSYLAFVLSVIAIVTMSKDDAVCFMMLIMSFANIFKSSPQSQSFFTYLVLFYVLWFFMKKTCMSKIFALSLALLVAFLTLQMVVSINMLRIIKFVANILFVYIAVNSYDNHSVKKLSLFYIIGVALSSSVAVLDIIPNLNGYIGGKETWIQDVQISRFAGLYADPNYYAVNVIISLCLIVVLNYKKELSAALTIFLGALMTIFAILTLSKSAFVMLLLPLFLLLYSKVKSRKYFVFLSTLIVSIIFALQIFAGKIEMFSDILYRFNKATDIDSLTTGRSYLWRDYIDFLFENPIQLLFGGGFGAGVLNGRAAHNTYIDLIYYLGIVGTMLMLLVFGVIIDIKKNTAKLNLFNCSIWICIALMYFFLSQLFYFDWAFHIVIAILISKFNMSQTEGE